MPPGSVIMLNSSDRSDGPGTTPAGVCGLSPPAYRGLRMARIKTAQLVIPATPAATAAATILPDRPSEVATSKVLTSKPE